LIYNDLRPQRIEDLVGAHLQPLRVDIKNNDIKSAYLLYGKVGCGKSSSARMLQNYLPNCKVIEINASADSTKKDAEKLIEKANSLGIGVTNQLVIIEEVQKASVGFQNAILTPLENPRKGVHWVLCTTEISKVIDTIRSRCKKIEYKALTKSEFKQVIIKGREYCYEKTPLSDKVLNIMYQRSEGSPRNGLSLLEEISDVDDEQIILERLQVIKEEDSPKVSALFWSLFNYKGRKHSISTLNTLREEQPESIRRIILKIAENELLKCPDTLEGDEDALVVHRIIKCFGAEIFTDYYQLVNAVLDFIEMNDLWRK